MKSLIRCGGLGKKNKRIKLLWITILNDPNKRNKRTGVCLSSVLFPLPSHSLDSACHNGIKCDKGSLMVCSGSDLSQFTVLNHFILSACRVGNFAPLYRQENWGSKVIMNIVIMDGWVSGHGLYFITSNPPQHPHFLTALHTRSFFPQLCTPLSLPVHPLPSTFHVSSWCPAFRAHQQCFILL